MNPYGNGEEVFKDQSSSSISFLLKNLDLSASCEDECKQQEHQRNKCSTEDINTQSNFSSFDLNTNQLNNNFIINNQCNPYFANPYVYINNYPYSSSYPQVVPFYYGFPKSSQNKVKELNKFIETPSNLFKALACSKGYDSLLTLIQMSDKSNISHFANSLISMKEQIIKTFKGPALLCEVLIYLNKNNRFELCLYLFDKKKILDSNLLKLHVKLIETSTDNKEQTLIINKLSFCLMKVINSNSGLEIVKSTLINFKEGPLNQILTQINDNLNDIIINSGISIDILYDIIHMYKDKTSSLNKMNFYTNIFQYHETMIFTKTCFKVILSLIREWGFDEISSLANLIMDNILYYSKGRYSSRVVILIIKQNVRKLII